MYKRLYWGREATYELRNTLSANHSRHLRAQQGCHIPRTLLEQPCFCLAALCLISFFRSSGSALTNSGLSSAKRHGMVTGLDECMRTSGMLPYLQWIVLFMNLL